jgi:hypothetical protein
MASIVEYMVVAGAVALAGLGCAKAFGDDVSTKMRGQGAGVAAIGDESPSAPPSAAPTAAATSQEAATATAKGPIVVDAAPTWRDAVTERASVLGDVAQGSARVALGGTMSLSKGVLVDGAGSTLASSWALVTGVMSDPAQAFVDTWEGFAKTLSDPRAALEAARDDFLEKWKADPVRAVGGALFTMTPVGRLGAMAHWHENGRAI